MRICDAGLHAWHRDLVVESPDSVYSGLDTRPQFTMRWICATCGSKKFEGSYRHPERRSKPRAAGLDLEA